MSRVASLRLDRELDAAIRHYADRNGLTFSQACREILRQAVTTADDVTRGWLEGQKKGYADFQKTARQCFDSAQPPTQG